MHRNPDGVPPSETVAQHDPPAVRTLVIQWRRMGSGPRFALDLARALHDQPGLEIAASYSSNGELADDWAALDVPSFPVRTYRNRLQLVLGLPGLLLTARHLRRFIEEQRIQVVFSPMYSVWQTIVQRLAIPRSVPLVASVHELDEHLGNAHWLRDAAASGERAQAAAFVTYSEIVRSELAGTGERRPVLRTHLGVVPRVRTTRTLPGDGERVLGLFGWIVAYKGPELFVDAIRLLRERGYSVRGRVDGAGDIPAELLERSRDVVDWNLGWVPEGEVPRVVGGYTVLCLPYLDGSQSAVLALGQGLAVPAVVTPVGALPEQIEASGGGVVAAETTAEAYADAVGRLLDDPALYASCSRSALVAAGERMSWKTVASAIAGFIVELNEPVRA